jgi:hypothetical protein
MNPLLLALPHHFKPENRYESKPTQATDKARITIVILG